MSNEIVEYLRKPESIERFADVLGSAGRANRYIQSVAIAVAANDDLLACTPRSILSAALRCASLQLSCDPATRQGQLVPFKNYKTGKMEAALIIHYVGLTILAERTNKYRAINVREVYDGWEVMENVYTGLHAISIPDLGILQDGYMPRWNMKETPVIGYLGYFETMRGFKKSIYMTIEEIEDHARKFSRGYNSPKSLWKDPKHLPTMRMKTVLRALAKWMDLGSDNDVLTQALEDFEGDPYDYEALDNGQEKEVELLRDLGYEEAGAVETTQATQADWLLDEPTGSELPALVESGEVGSGKFSREAVIAAGMFSDGAAFASVWNRSPFVRRGKHSDAAQWQWFRQYRAGRDEGLSADEAIGQANELLSTEQST